MPDDLRAVLEGILYGDDPKITPGDRLRAAEQLQQLDGGGVASIRQLILDMDPAEVAAEWDRYCGAQTVADALAGKCEYPCMAEAIYNAVEERALALARDLADADRIEREVERRAEERAEELYRRRAFKAVSRDVSPTQPRDPAPAATRTERGSAPDVAPPGLSAADLERPWQRPRRVSPFSWDK